MKKLPPDMLNNDKPFAALLIVSVSVVHVWLDAEAASVSSLLDTAVSLTAVCLLAGLAWAALAALGGAIFGTIPTVGAALGVAMLTFLLERLEGMSVPGDMGGAERATGAALMVAAVAFMLGKGYVAFTCWRAKGRPKAAE